GVQDNVNFLRPEDAGIGKEARAAGVVPEIGMHAGLERGIETAEIVQFRDVLISSVGNIEIVTERWTKLELAVEHVFAVIGIGRAIESLLRAVVETGNSSRG